MTSIGLPVPQGFTVSTEACTAYYEDGKQISPEICAQIDNKLAELEAETGKKLGDPTNPLLVSVRSGARASMPGMMDTILNLGLNEEVVETLAEASGNPRWAWDCYRRFIQMFSDVVMEVGKKYFEELIDKMKADRGVKQDVELTAEDLKELANQFKAEYKEKIGSDFPSDPKEQLMEAVKAVFRSWDNPRANVYRRDNDIPYSWGTAVNVQMMAFGNMGDDCGTGVAFTRDPATGENGLFGEFLTNAQGEDVVAGVRTPMHISEMEEKFPEAFVQFKQVCETLEKHYRDMQDMEFTVEHGKLYMLQTRNGKRTAQAALKIACDLVDEGMRTEEEAVAMIDPRNLDSLLHPQFDAKALKEAFAWNKGFKEFFAVKATPNPYLIQILQEYGCGCDCSSMTELMLSKAIGCKKGDIMFSSNDTPEAEFRYANEIGGIINLDDITHIKAVEKAVGYIPKTISCRYNPGGVFKISNDIMDNPGDAKYGMTTEQIFEAFRTLKAKGAENFGIHAFLASNTVTNEYYPMLAKVMFELAVKLQKETGAHIGFINLSGGIGIPYRPDQTPNDIRVIGEGVRKVYEEVLVPAGMGDVAIYTELGRFMMGPYGCLVTKAIHEKHTHKEYIGVDACAVNLMRPAMYGAYPVSYTHLTLPTIA